MKEINFMDLRQKFGIVSVALVVLSLGYLMVGPGVKKSVDFEGGTKLTVAFKDQVEIGSIREAVGAVEPGSTIVALGGEEGAGSEFTIKIRKTDEEAEESSGGLSIKRLLRLQAAFASLGNDDADLLALLNSVDQAVLAEKLRAANVLNLSDSDQVVAAQHADLAARVKGAVAGSSKVADVAGKALPENPEGLIVGLNSVFHAVNRTTTDLMGEIFKTDNPLGRADDADYADVVAKIEAKRAAGFDFLKSIDEGAEASGEGEAFVSYMKNNFYLGSYKVVANESFSASIAAELLSDAWTAVILALLGILVYVGLRFQWGYAVASVVALTHDVIIALGVFAILGGELSNPVVAAFLTIVGYSLNDTIVVFDRIRDNLHTAKQAVLIKLMNTSINQTLSRTVVTSITTFFVVAVIYFFSNNETLRDFSLPLLIGIIVGTYSSIFVASPVLALWDERVRKVID